MPDFEAWAVFAKVAELRSFTAAAEALALSTGTVSKAVSRLEASLGVTLFHRTTRRLALTPAGANLASRAAALLSDAQEVEDDARNEAGVPRGLVRIAAPMSFGLSHLAPLLPSLADELPAVTIDLDLDDAPTDLIARGIDVSLRIGWLPDSRLKARKLRDVRSILVASPGYLDRNGTPARPADLGGHVTLAYTYLRPHDRWTLENDKGETTQVNVRNLLVTNSGDAMLPLLREGRAIAMVPDFMVQPDIEHGSLVHVLPGWGYRPAALYLVTPSSGPRPARVSAVIDFLVANLG